MVKKIIIHSVCWLALISCFMLLAWQTQPLHKLIVVFVYFGILNVGIFYANYLWAMPAVLHRKRYIRFALSLTGIIILAGLVKYALAYAYSDYVLLNPETHKRTTFPMYFLHTLFSSFFMLFISSAVKFMVEWFSTDKANKSLEKEKLSAELAFLKSQINPHFLLNSLNNIYSLAYQKSDKTPEAVLKLSEIMRYMLYESNDKKVAIGKEVRYLENYIELQKIRFKDSAFIDLTIDGDHDGETIEPLILIPFIENAFKHGVITDPANPVTITIRIKNSRLCFTVTNKKANQNKDETGGIGFHNIQRRLELLYPGKHTLTITDEPEFYTCELSLDLS